MIITGGKYKGQKITAPNEKITRPTLSKVRMAVFNTLQSIIDFEGKSFFDMFGGSGIMGLEALSRGFDELLVCEQNKEVYRILKNNLKKYEEDNKIKSVCGDSLKLGQSLDKKYDVIYMDPPYFSGIYEKTLKIMQKKGELFILEHSTDINFIEFNLLKQKKYGNKFISFIVPKQ